MSHNPRQGEWAGRRLMLVLGVLGPCALAVVAAGWWWMDRHEVVQITLASGAPGGTYQPLGRGIAEILEEQLPGAEVKLVETGGSAENMAWLADGRATLAFVQNDTPGNRDIRTAVALYDEVLQVVVRRPEAVPSGPVGPEMLRGARISMGPEGGGTGRVARALLDHAGLPPDSFTPTRMRPDAAVEALKAGQIDAACFLSGLRTGSVETLLADPRMALISFGDPEARGGALAGLQIHMPFLEPTLIPRGTYGHTQRQPVGTVAVRALLATHKGVPEALIREVSRLVLANKVELARHHPVAGHLFEDTEDRGLRFPFHPGADAWLRRHEPAVWVEYAPAMSFVFSVILALGSVGLGFRETLRRRRKNRIDVYYLKLDELSATLTEERTAEELRGIRSQLLALRQAAFHELVAERLNADASFLIFLDFLGAQMAEVDRLLREVIHG